MVYEKRVIKFQSVHQHFKTKEIVFSEWGPEGEGSFRSPSYIHGYKFVAHRRFIGLHDKDGKEIYEGDILKYGDFAFNDVAKFGKEPWKNLPDGVNEKDISTEVSRFTVDGDIKSLYELLTMIEDNPDVLGVEIIGNIYENPVPA